VTTGSVGPVLGVVQNSSFQGLEFHKTWNGVDGKYEPYAGGTRLKWNNFTLTAASRNRPSKYAEWYRWQGAANLKPQYMGKTYGALVSWNGFGAEPTWTTADTNKLLAKLATKVKGHDFNLAVNLAQMHQVSSMVAFNLGQLGRSIMALKHGDFATAARCLGTKPRSSRLKPSDISGRWLELQYGWLPTLSDTFEAVKAFHEISEGPRKAIIRTSVSKKAWPEGSQSPNQFSSTYEFNLTRRIQYEMYEEMTAERSLGLLDPLTVAWEIIPYSFVVDWFVPIGTYLDNLNAIPKLKGRFLTTTTTRRRGFSVLRGIPQPFSAFSLSMVASGSISDYFKQTNVDRVYSTSLSVPPPSFNIGGAVHGRRIWNAISLAQIRFGSGKKPRNTPIFKRSVSARIKTFRGSNLI